MKITSCGMAGLKDCLYCRSTDAWSRPEGCFIDIYTYSLKQDYNDSGAAKFKKHILKHLLYFKGKRQFYENNPPTSYLIAAIKRYYPQHIDDLNKMLLLL